MAEKSIALRIFSVLMVLTFISGQGCVYASNISSSKLAPSLITDADINPARSSFIQGLVADMQKRSKGLSPNAHRAETTIGYSYVENPLEREEQIEAILREIKKEEVNSGAGVLPHMEVAGDTHGGLGRFAQLLSGMLARLCGFQGQLDPYGSIQTQLEAQGLSLKTMNGAIVINGDLLDRGEYGIACFLLVKEMVETAPDRVFFIPGNHDIMAIGGILGIHLPWYEGYSCDGDPKAEQASIDAWVKDLIAKLNA